MIEVVSAVIVRADRMLLTQRPTSKDYPFMWESPGGKVEGNESHHDAIRRELREEIGVEVTGISEDVIWCGEIERPGREPVFDLMYPVVLPRLAQPRPLEGQGIGWFTADEIATLRLAPANAACRVRLLDHLAVLTRTSR